MPTRTRLDTEKRREQLVEVGLALFGNQPYDQVSLDEIAYEAGVSRSLIYHYFSDKRMVYLAVLRAVAEQMLAATRTDLNKPAVERLYEGLGAHLDFAEKYSTGYIALMSGGNGNDEEVRALCESYRWEGLEEIVRSLQIVDPAPALRIALRGWVGFQEGAILQWLKQRDPDRQELLDLLAAALGAALDLGGFRGAVQLSPTGSRTRV